MIRIAETPAVLSLAKNPIVFKFTHENNGQLMTSQGAKSVLIIPHGIINPNLPGFFDEGQSILLKVTTTDLKVFQNGYTFKSVPNGASDIPLSTTLLELVALFQHNPIFAPYLDIIGVDEQDQYVLTAQLKYQEAISVEWLFTPTNSRNYTIQNIPLSTLDDTEAEMEVFFEKTYRAANWTKSARLKLFFYHTIGFTHANIANILEAECVLSLPENPFVHYSRTLPTISNNIKRFYVVIWDNNQPIYDTVRYVINGGLSNRIWLKTPFNPSFNNAFLTYQPDFKRLALSSIEYLTWFNYKDTAQTVALTVKPYSGNTSLAEKAVYSMGVPPSLCVTLPVSPSALSLDPFVTHYEILLKNAQNELIAPIRSFIIGVHKPIRLLAYLNTWGVPEVVTCTGSLTTRIVITAETWSVIRHIQAGVSILKNERLVSEMTRKYTYRTGFITQQQKEAYTELTLSPRVFDITTPQYQGLVLTESKIEDLLSEEGEYLYTIEWQFEPLISENAFAPDELIRKTATLTEPPAFPHGVGSGINNGTGLKAFYLTQAEFDQLVADAALEENALYFITDQNPQQVWFSGGENAAVNITFGPLRYVKVQNLTSDTLIVQGISVSTPEERERMRFYRGNLEIFLDGDITIEPNDIIRFTIPFENETFRAFY